MIKNVLANWSNVVFLLISAFVLYPFFVETLGEKQYGVWLLISSATGYFSLLRLGVPMANVRFISKYVEKKQFEKINEIICTNLCFFTAAAILILVLGFGLSCLLDVLFEIPTEFLEVARLTTVLVSVDMAICFVFEVFEGFFHARQNFVVFNIIKNVVVVAKIFGVLLLVDYERGLLKVAFVMLIFTIIQSIAFYIYVRTNNPQLKIRIQYVKLETFRKIFGYSIFVLFLQLAMHISFYTDSLVLGSFVSVSAIVWFSIANNLLLYFMKFIGGISSALMPKISTFETRGETRKIQYIYVFYSRMVIFLVLPACLFFWCFGADFIALWMGEDYRTVSGAILSILTIGYCFYLVQSAVALPILMGTSKVKYPTFIVFFGALINLGLSVILGKQYGVYGVAWGTTIPLVLIVGGLVWYTCKTYSISVFHYISQVILSPILAIVCYLLTYYVISVTLTIDSFHVLIASGTLCSVFYALTIYFIVLSCDEKSFVRRKIFFRIS